MGTPEFPDLLIRWDPLGTGHYSAGRPSGPPLWGVVHCTSNTASNESEDAYAHTRTDASAHGYFDNDDWGIGTVLTTDRAWSALRTGNLYGVHVEITGDEAWTREQWLTLARQSIRAAAVFLAACARKYRWDLVRLTTAQVAALGPTGFCGHKEITDAFPADNGTHTDPGPNFPWDVFMSDVQQGGDVTTTEAAANASANSWSVRTGANTKIYPNDAPGTPIDWGNPLWDLLRRLDANVAADLAEDRSATVALKALTDQIGAAGGNVDAAPILAAIAAAREEESATVAALHDQVAELGVKLSAAIDEVARLRAAEAAGAQAEADALKPPTG